MGLLLFYFLSQLLLMRNEKLAQSEVSLSSHDPHANLGVMSTSTALQASSSSVTRMMFSPLKLHSTHSSVGIQLYCTADTERPFKGILVV